MAKTYARELLVLRHAKSSWNTEAPTDFERPLGKRGERDAPRMGAWLAERALVPSVIVSSAARRARETAERVAVGLGLEPSDVRTDERLYDASVRAVLEVLGECADHAERVMVVGHNPTMAELVYWLPAEPPPVPANGKLMPTCTIAHLGMPADWRRLSRGCARLEGIHRPKEVLE